MKFGRIAIVFLLISIGVKSYGQDAAFSQYYASGLYLNPALVGAENDITFKSNYRTQWRTVTLPYVTSQVSLIYPWVDRKHHGADGEDKHIGGFGVSFYNDKAGDGNFKTLGVSVSAAYTLQLSQITGKNMLNFGLQGGFIQKQLDFTNLEWGKQFNPYLGFDPTIDPAETSVLPTTTNPDLNAGIVWFYNKFELNNTHRFSAYSGVSVSHLTPVDESLIQNEYSRLPILYKYHGGLNLHFLTHMDISTNVLILHQNNNTQVNVGVFLTYEAFKKAIHYSVRDAHIIGGVWYRLQDSYIAMVGLENPFYTIGFSYDMNASQLRTTSRGTGAYEISISIRKLKERKKLNFSTPRI